MKKSNKQPNVNNSSTEEIRPELFNFFENMGRSVLITLKNDNAKTGMLLGICDNQTILLELGTTQGHGCISETPLFDISEIIILDETSSLKFTSKN